MLFKSTRFGDLEIDEKDIIKFPNGLPGFPEEQKFILLPCQENSPFSFLQSASEANLAFLVVDPFMFFTDYEFKIEDELVQELNLSANNPPQVFSIVTVPDCTEEMTVNLLAPIIINTQDRIGLQFVLEKTNYKVKHLLFPQGLPQKGNKGGK